MSQQFQNNIINDQQLEQTICLKCQIAPENYIQLNCGHSFCLKCISQHFMDLQGNIRNKSLSLQGIKCEICNQKTELDSQSIKAIEDTINEMIIQFQPVLDNSALQIVNQDETPRKSINNILKQANFTSDQKNNPYNSGDEEDKKQIMLEQNNQVNQIQQHQPQPQQTTSTTNKCEQHQQPLKLFESNALLNSQQSLLNSAAFQTPVSPKEDGCCGEHPFEEFSLFCFSCENKCLCLKCLLDGTHKNHDVRNFNKGFQVLKDKIKETSHQIKANIEIILLNQKKLDDKQKTFENKVNFIRKQIADTFSELHNSLELKKAELLAEVDQFKNKKMNDFQNEIESFIKKQNALTHMLDSFSQITIQADYNDNLTGLPKLFKFYAENKLFLNQIINNSEEQIPSQLNSKQGSPQSNQVQRQFLQINDSDDVKSMINQFGATEMLENLNQLKQMLINFKGFQDINQQLQLLQQQQQSKEQQLQQDNIYNSNQNNQSEANLTASRYTKEYNSMANSSINNNSLTKQQLSIQQNKFQQDDKQLIQSQQFLQLKKLTASGGSSNNKTNKSFHSIIKQTNKQPVSIVDKLFANNKSIKLKDQHTFFEDDKYRSKWLDEDNIDSKYSTPFMNRHFQMKTSKIFEEQSTNNNTKMGLYEANLSHRLFTDNISMSRKTNISSEEYSLPKPNTPKQNKEKFELGAQDNKFRSSSFHGPSIIKSLKKQNDQFEWQKKILKLKL